MNETKFVLVLGPFSGGDEDRRTCARLICRNREPVRFWLTCISYGTVGIAVLAFVTLLLFR